MSRANWILNPKLCYKTLSLRNLVRESILIHVACLQRTNKNKRNIHIYSTFSSRILDGVRGEPYNLEKLPSHEPTIGLSGDIKIENRRRNDITTPRPHELYSPSHEHYQVLFCTSPRTSSGYRRGAKREVRLPSTTTLYEPQFMAQLAPCIVGL